MVTHASTDPRAILDLRQNTPQRMQQDRQWVGFKLRPKPNAKPAKLPVVATCPEEMANCSDSTTWRSFDETMAGLDAGRFDAIAYALNGNGIVGIDLDNLIGDWAGEAQCVVQRFGSYAEWSISGAGIHILTEGHLAKGRRRGNVEVYDQCRFFIMTGKRMVGVPATVESNQPALDWLLEFYFDGSERSFPERPERTESPEHPENSENPEVISSGLSLLSVFSGNVEAIIEQTQPKRTGERNECILKLARGLKFDAAMKGAELKSLKPLVRQWHTQALPALGTKPFDETWSDFLRAWKYARHPLDAKWLETLWQNAQKGPRPVVASQYDSEPVQKLVTLCDRLAAVGQQGRFFLSSHRAGTLLGVSHTAVLKWLKMMEVDGVIKTMEAGNSRRATRYQYLPSPSSAGQVGSDAKAN